MHVASASVTPVSAAIGHVNRGAGAAGNVHRHVRASRPQPAAIADDATHEASHVA